MRRLGSAPVESVNGQTGEVEIDEGVSDHSQLEGVSSSQHHSRPDLAWQTEDSFTGLISNGETITLSGGFEDAYLITGVVDGRSGNPALRVHVNGSDDSSDYADDTIPDSIFVGGEFAVGATIFVYDFGGNVTTSLLNGESATYTEGSLDFMEFEAQEEMELDLTMYGRGL